MAVIQNIKSWTDTHLTESVFVSNDFLRTNGVELSLDNSSAGILVSNFNQCEKNKMVWFRKEFSQEINWAGNLSAENELLKTIRENNKNMNDFLSNLENIMDNDTLKNNEMLKLEIQKIKNLMNEH